MGIIYLMQRKWRSNHNGIVTQCRIGQTIKSLYRRCISEGATAGWIIFEEKKWDDIEGRALETHLASEYGIPETNWKSTLDSVQSYIDKVWNWKGDNWKRGLIILERFEKNPEEPDWTISQLSIDKADKQRSREAARIERCGIHFCKASQKCQNYKPCRGSAEAVL